MIDNKPIALAAAQGLTPRVVRSWYADLPRTPRVLVPVHLDALVVRKPGGAWAKTNVNGQTAPPLFENLPSTRPTGAYLHWSLPDALTRGVPNESGDTSTEARFPPIPDRWLVVRLHPSPRDATRRTIRGWVLRAGDATPSVVPLDEWIESGPAGEGGPPPLTAVGPGDPGWAAYFDNVQDRMAFYDDLSDVPAGPVAYLVCGWHADETLDPLGDPDIKSLTAFHARLKALRWALDDKSFQEAVKKAETYMDRASKSGLNVKWGSTRSETSFGGSIFRTNPQSIPQGPPWVTDGSWWPAHTLYHGSVVGIGWPGIGWKGNDSGILSEETGGPPAADQLTVVAGVTGGEALADLVASRNASRKEARVLEAFQMGVLADFDHPDGRARIDALLHAKGFASQPGGSVVERVWEPPAGRQPDVPPTPPADKGVFKGNYRGMVRTGPTKVGGVLPKSSSGVKPMKYQGKQYMQESYVYMGGLSSILEMVSASQVESYKPGRWVDMTVALPRYFRPADPVVLVEGIKRSFRHGSDGRFTADGSLQCRLTGTCIHEFVPWKKDISYPPIHPEDILDRGVENGSVPVECEELLGETALLDPGSAAPVAQYAGSLPGSGSEKGLSAETIEAEARRLMVEQTAWWSVRDPRVDHGPLIARTNYSGRLPSPVAVTPPCAPWTPLHLEWRIEYIPSPDGVDDWTLGELDFNESVPDLPPPSPANVITLQGRSPVTAGVNRALASTIRNAIEQMSRAGGSAQVSGKFLEGYASKTAFELLGAISELVVGSGKESGVDKDALEDVATALESMDVISATFNGLHRDLRGGYTPDGVSAPGDGTIPTPFHVLRSGFVRVLRLRIVDCFGQFVDLAGSDASTPVDPARLGRSEPLEVTTRPELLAFPPRFTAPARLWFRFLDGLGSGEEARLASDIAPSISPVCGYLMPDHLDRSLEFFSAEGDPVGQIRVTEAGAIVWEDAPGQPATVGKSPTLAIPNRYLGSVGQSLIDWGLADAGMAPGLDTALGGLLRTVDSTLWSIDPFGHQADEHLSLLVGHPLVVVRAILRLELLEPVAPDLALTRRVPIRLGALAHFQDGLLGYFVNDDYHTLHCPDPAAAGFARRIGPNEGFLQQANLTDAYYDQFGSDLPAGAAEGSTPVDHPYIDTSGIIFGHPNQDILLTMIVEPHTLVHATSGILPRKEIGMRREWVKDALAKLAPTFRFGPVLIDPRKIRMPVAHDLNGAWSWDHRTDVNTWANDPVVHATGDAVLAEDPLEASEGWLRLTPVDEQKEGG